MLDAACAVFAAQGFANTTMEAIASRAGTTKPTLYARFGAKDQLFARAVRREHELLNSWIAEGAPGRPRTSRSGSGCTAGSRCTSTSSGSARTSSG